MQHILLFFEENTYTTLLRPTRLFISEKSATYTIKWSYMIIWQVRVTIKGGPGGKICDWYMILHYFPEYLTSMLTLGLRSYRSPNLALVLQMWENLESNLPVCN